MPKHILFVCQSCHRSSEEQPEEQPEDQPTDGAQLLEQLNTLACEQSQSDEFGIQPVACL
jgi:predicted metal-binding protein